MKIIIAGGAGHLGAALTRTLRSEGHRVVVLTRNPDSAGLIWDGRTIGDWAGEIDGCDAVINLAGRSVDCRYDARHREEIFASRVDSTRVLGAAIARSRRPPPVWLQASTATIYAHRYDAPNDEYDGVIGGSEPGIPDTWRFSINVARAWEEALDEAHTPDTRRVKMRTAMVMSAARGGAFEALLRHVRLGLGRLGDGRQYVSWIHERDFVRAVAWLIERSEIEGAVNLSAPEPLANEQFLRILREEWGETLSLPVPHWMVEIGAWLMRTESELILKSRRVVPVRLLEHDFRFQFPEWREAVRDLHERWLEGREVAGALQPSPRW